MLKLFLLETKEEMPRESLTHWFLQQSCAAIQGTPSASPGALDSSENHQDLTPIPRETHTGRC